MEGRNLLDLPDVVLRNVLQYLTVEDRISLLLVDERFEHLTSGRHISRVCNVGECYKVNDDGLKRYLNTVGSVVTVLNLKNCYWLSQRSIIWAINKCKNLKELHVVECKLKTDNLVTAIANRRGLQALSFTVSSFVDLTSQKFVLAKDALKTVNRLEIWFSSVGIKYDVTLQGHGQYTSVLDFCHNLRELHVYTNGMSTSIDLWRPIISHPERYKNVKVLAITNNLHAGAQLFFYAIMSELPTSEVKWQSLITPNINFQEFVKSDRLSPVLRNIEQIRILNLADSKCTFEDLNLFEWKQMSELRHLNARSTFMSDEVLQSIAVGCANLTSLNLYGCIQLFHKAYRTRRSSTVTTGLSAIVQNCHHLKHLNLAGVDHHLADQLSFKRLEPVLNSLKGLKSLGLPTCILLTNTTGDILQRPQKRIMSTRGRGRAPNTATAADGRNMLVTGGYANPALPCEIPIPDEVFRQQATSQKRKMGDNNEPEDGPSTSSPPGSQAGSVSARLRTSRLQNEGPVTLDWVVPNNPNLEHVEVIAVKFTSIFSRNKVTNPKVVQFNPCKETRFVRDAEIRPLAKLSNLKSLTLIGLPGLLTGSSVVEICTSCQKLQQLSIAYIGASSFSSVLCQALPKCKNLKDLRIEQPHMPLNDQLFVALGQCTSLQRLCLIVKHSTFPPKAIVALMQTVTSLIVLQIFCGNTLSTCKTLTTTMNKRFAKSRPGLSISISQLLHDSISEVLTSIPAKHQEEVTRFDSRVASQMTMMQ